MTMILDNGDLGPFLKNSYGDEYLYPVNRDVFNRLGSKAFYASHYGESLGSENSLFVLVGSDSGLLIRYLNERSLPRGSRFIVVELPDVLQRVSEVLDLDSLHPQVVVVTPDMLDHQLTEFQIDEYTYLSKVFMLESIGASDQNLPDYIDLSVHCNLRLESRTWQVRAQLGNRDFALKQLQNLPENHTGFYRLKGAFKGKTAVVLGAGPSLDEVIPWVMENREDLVVLAVSRVCQRLCDVGLAPDFICSIDPQTVSFIVSRAALELQEESVLLAYYHAASELVGQWHGQQLYAGPRFPWDSELNHDDFGFSGPTVSHMTIDAAIKLGCSQILLAGVDLCFSREGFSHAQGNKERESGVALVKRSLISVKTNGDWDAETTVAYANGIHAIEMLAQRAKEAGAELMNSAIGAAKMDGVNFLPLDQIQIEPMSPSARETLREILPPADADYRCNHYEASIQELKKARQKLVQIQLLCKKALKANEGLFGRGNKQASFQYKHEMDRIEARLNKEYGTLSKVVKHYAGDLFLKLVSPERNISGWSDEDIEKVGRGYYQAFIDGAQEVMALLDEARHRLECRLTEESPSPDLKVLRALWQQDNTPGRLDLWRRRHPEQWDRVPTDLRTDLEPLDEVYAEQRRTGGECKEHEFDPAVFLEDALHRMHQLFRRQDREGLERIQSLLESREEKGADLVKTLMTAYLAEIDQQMETALTCYNQLLEVVGDSAMVETALRRIISLTLEHNDLENALLALQCLAEMSPTFVPQYAELLRILGEYEAALAVYEDYSERFPTDYNTLLKMAHLHQTMGNLKGAQMVTDFVLEHQPENEAARLYQQELQHLPGMEEEN